VLDRTGSEAHPTKSICNQWFADAIVIGRADVTECRKGKHGKKGKPGRYQCKQCGAVSKKKRHVCQPKKIKDRRDKGGEHG